MDDKLRYVSGPVYLHLGESNNLQMRTRDVPNRRHARVEHSRTGFPGERRLPKKLLRNRLGSRMSWPWKHVLVDDEVNHHCLQVHLKSTRDGRTPEVTVTLIPSGPLPTPLLRVWNVVREVVVEVVVLVDVRQRVTTRLRVVDVRLEALKVE